MKIEDYIGKPYYDKEGIIIWGEGKDGGLHHICDIRGWGAIQNLFKTEEEAIKFHDELGEWIADAFNQKLKNQKP